MLVIVGISTFMVGLSVSKVSVSVWVDMESARTFYIHAQALVLLTCYLTSFNIFLPCCWTSIIFPSFIKLSIAWLNGIELKAWLLPIL